MTQEIPRVDAQRLKKSFGTTPAVQGVDLTIATPRVEVQRLKKFFGTTPAVQGVDLAIATGEFFTLLGPSGSGKTTTLRLIAGLESPSTGEILIDGHAVTRKPPEKRDIGMVFQHYALFPHLTVFDNVAFPLRMRHMGRAEIKRSVLEALTMTEMREHAGRFPAQLSGGQQQRVALARASAFRPRILLMDEPLNALDRRLRDLMRIELKLLQERSGATVLYVTHDQQEALSMSDRVGLMREGRLEQIGTPADLYQRPVSAFAAKFLGDASILDAQRAGQDGEGRLILNVPSVGRKVVVRVENDLCDGDSGVLVVRPENLTISGAEPSSGQKNRLLGTFVAVSYLGDHLDLIAENDGGGERMMGRCQRLPEDLTIGGKCWVSWDISDGCFVPRT
jgi:putative spermidine/putrescine transport system ATP-binding protein